MSIKQKLLRKRTFWTKAALSHLFHKKNIIIIINDYNNNYYNNNKIILIIIKMLLLHQPIFAI